MMLSILFLSYHNTVLKIVRKKVVSGQNFKKGQNIIILNFLVFTETTREVKKNLTRQLGCSTFRACINHKILCRKFSKSLSVFLQSNWNIMMGFLSPRRPDGSEI